MSQSGAVRTGVNPWLATPAVALAAFMEVLDTSIANVALQHIAGSLSASASEASWVLTSYLVTNAVVIPISGWLATRFGRKRVFMTCIAGFTVSSFLCGFAPSLAALIIMRAIQGATGGGLQPNSQAIMSDAFPASKRGMAMALYGMAVVSAPAIGPTLGGWLTDNFSWRWVFLINVPVGIIVFSLVGAMIKDPPEMREEREQMKQRGSRIDYIGFSLIALGLGCMQVVLDRGQEDDWFSSGLITIMTITCVAALVATVIWELRQRDPLMDLRLLKNRDFAVANILMLTLGFMLIGSTFLLPSFTQTLLGYTATDAGTALTPGAIVLMFMMPVVGRLITVVDTRRLIAFGLVAGAFSMYLMAGFNLQIDYNTIVLIRMIQAAGLSFLFIPINTIAFQGIPRNRTNYASAIINLSRNIGGSIGISVAATMLTRRTQVHQNELVDRFNDYDPGFNRMLGGLKELYAHAGNVLSASHQALATAYQALQQQAALLSYLDVFEVYAALFVVLLPLMLLIKPGHPEGEVEPMAH